MEESQEILLNSLRNVGVSIPDNVPSIKELTPTTLISICAQSLNIIGNTTSFVATLPDSMADKFRVCTNISAAVKNLGYLGDVSYYKFLYPSEEDLYKLLRFLVERLSELSEDITDDITDTDARSKIQEDNFSITSADLDNEGVDLNLEKVGAILNDLRVNTEVPESSVCNTDDTAVSASNGAHLFIANIDESVDGLFDSKTPNFSKDGLSSFVSEDNLAEGIWESGRGTSGNEEAAAQRDDTLVSVFEHKVASHKEPSLKIRYENEYSKDQEKKLPEEMIANSSGLQHLEEEFESLKAAADMSFDDQKSVGFYLEQLYEQVEARKRNLVDLESQWDAFRKPLEEKKRNLEDSLCANKPEVREKLQKLREVEVERLSILSEIRKREEEHLKLSADLEKQPKVASRLSYIQRIKEITKNSRKQDADIERILIETRELQLESNSIQERLQRTYAIVDEMVFREAKKDPVGRQAYRLLSSIHETFEQISEKILTSDRIKREVADHDKKLAAMVSRNLTADKLQADLDAIMKENEYLQQRLQEN
ncbi:DUF812 domain-containing protein [Cephalotus follicularis]|uniref:DUF812 domain-containing protein n=1 Tax=Cephalotus follicularis TaxID=3775 RepID=A0A1Q3AV80_CEPFO|nr:DUF812 domain-containing protein [Cephalotus follicularis]